MKNIFIILTLALLTTTVKGVQPTLISTHPHTVNVDSTIFYFNKAKTPNGIDTLAFQKGLISINNIVLNDNSIKRIQNKAKEFIGTEKSRFYTSIESALFNAILNAQRHHKAIDFGKEIISRYQATQNTDERNLLLSVLTNMRIPFRLSDKLEDGFDYYTSQLKLYLQKNDSVAISICYYVHGGFYATKGLNDLSIYYYKKSILYLNENDTVYGNAYDLYSSGRSAWVNNTAVVGKIYNDLGDYHNAILYSRATFKFGVKNKILNTHRPYVHKNIAYAKIMLNELDSVLYYLNIAIAEVKSSKQQIANCYLVKGIYYMHTNQLDSSEFYLNQCNNLIEENHLPANSTDGKLVPNYYRALCRIKQNRYKDAADLLITEISRLGNLRQELINEYSLLVEVYLKLGDVKNAAETFTRCNTLREQLEADERSNRKISFETEQKIAEAEGTITNLENERKVAAITRNFLTGGLIVLLIFSIVFFLQRNKIAMGKKESDELLLNILPSEVAEELKAKGSADAKQFEGVTVMFTDFKGFTQLSEKLSPKELVGEINECFSAFDHIMQKHGIEKIKTIGDAYMSAGGLPTSNTTHANDVVLAALEIQQFMHEHKAIKEAAGQLFFEIRIGVHSGPVVAGIVGIKKFAYDIWGDTVNTASRMESSGEVGKVNVSGTTYELVKDKFNCIHRGKITAKGKGEIDMYFVEVRI